MLGQTFQKYIQNNQIVGPEEVSLIAVSGGIDSVVLCHLFHENKLAFAIAHCNFKLRGADAEADEAFVETLAHHYQVQFYKIAFDTESISAKEKKSVQIIARELRYEWLYKLVDQHGFDHLATAHHMNDRIETFLYNFTKGTGIRGLCNMEAKSGKLIRPLLFASKADMLDYAKEQQLDYREDSSNLSTKYSRNKIRLKVIPALKEINPALEKTALETFKNLEETEKLFQWAVQQHRDKLLTEKNGQWHIAFQQVQQCPAPTTLLHELICSFGFNRSQINNILNEHTRVSGAQFITADYRLVISRNELIITKQNQPQEATIQIEEETELVSTPHANITLTTQTDWPAVFPESKHIAWLDADQLQFPLTLRRWKAGDVFQPLGMNGQKQKVKKYLTNQKLSLLEKEQVLVLISQGNICWLVGLRPDERFRIRTDTRRILRIEVTSNQI